MVHRSAVRPHPQSRAGRHPIKVGRASFGVIPGSKVAHVSEYGRPGCYVLDQDGTIVLLTESGEIDVPQRLWSAIRARYFPD